MKHALPHTLPRIYVYVFFLALCLVGLMHGSTIISSSRSLTDAGVSAEGRGHSIDLGNSLKRVDSPLLGELTKLFLQTPSAKVAPKVLADTAGGKATSVVVLLADQADVSAADDMTDQDARGWYVYNTLTQHAARTQVGLTEYLKTQGVTYQSFWVANALQINADKALVDALAARQDVAKIESNMPQRWIEEPQIANAGKAPLSPNAVELGVTNVNAPQVWALGFTGQGIVIGNQDTGMRWDHNALKPKYRGWNGAVADHNYNWHDSIHTGGGTCGPNSAAPCDDNGHGTHTTGTTVGDDGTGNQVGVAPGAKWIGCRNMDQGNGTPTTYMECFQFFVAPTDSAGNNPNPALRPHVMNNSWGCPPSEGCAANTLNATVIAAQNAGIFVVVSAGNAGSACSTVNDPPAIYAESFSVGAINAATNTLASFSSRGPVTVDGSNRPKPNISAPGVAVRSSVRTSVSSYGNNQGTSMAGPHVVGVVALLWSARSALVRNIAQTKTILQMSANPAVTVTPAQTCGGTTSTQIPNNSFGYGRVDALAAVNLAPTAAPGRISGTITAAGGQPLAGVTVNLGGASTRKTITDSSGNYRFDNVATDNFYTVTPALVNYHFSPGDQSFSLAGNKTDAGFSATRDSVISGAAIDTADYFVRQHYVDFLSREPDESGFNFWSNQISECGGDAGCVERRRINVSAAYFLSIEFQETGGLVDGLYRASFGRQPLYAEFVPDAAVVGSDIIVGQGDWAADLNANKQEFIEAWVQRQAFRAAYDGLSNDDYINELVAHTGVDFSSSERAALVSGLTSGALTRAGALRQIVEDGRFIARKRNETFVMMQYFGYLRRDPDAGGYQFWLDKLNQFNGNFEQAEMVKAFIVSGEYRSRFPQ
jgi:subtilisin family serine protease